MIRINITVLMAVLLCCLAISEVVSQTNIKDLTLDESTSLAMLQNPKIIIATQRAIEGREKVAAKRGIILPQIDFRTDVQTYHSLPNNKRIIIGGGNTDVYSALNLSMLLFSSGKAEANIDSATTYFFALQEDLRKTRQEVAFDVAKSYYSVLRLKAILVTREEAVKQMEHYLTVAKEKNEIGKAPMLDVLRAEVQLADVNQARLLVLNQLDVAHLELLNAIGIQNQDISVIPLEDNSQAVSYTEPTVFIQEALNTNPEYLRSQYLIKAAEKDVKAARGEYGPNISLVASYNKEGNDIPNVTNWNAGLAFSVPVFNGGITRAKVGQAVAIVEQNKSAMELISQRITLAVRSAVLSTQDAANRLAATQKSVEKAQEALNIAQEKYAVGLGSTTEVIDTQVSLVQAQTNYTQAIYDGKVAVAALNYAVGRDPVTTDKADLIPEGVVK